jgi:CNT family concentrative nucleoside transporter
MTASADADKPANVLDAASGAASGMQLALNVGAMLLAFIALIALLNGISLRRRRLV